MGKKYSGRRPEDQPVFTKPTMLDLEKRRMFIPIMAGSPTPHPSLTPSIAATYTVAASDAPAAWKARADTKCNGTNDHLNIQGALDAGYDVLLSPGTFNVEVSLTLDSYNMLRGCGKSSILTTTTADVDILTATGSDGSEKVGIILKEFCVDGDAGSATNDCGIIFEYVDYSTIQNVYSQDNGEMGVFLLRSDYNKVVGCTFQSNDYALFLDVSTYNNIFDNTCQGSATADIYAEDASDHNTIVGNTCDGTVGVWLYDSCFNTIVGNTLSENAEEGIDLQTNSNGNTVVGNTCKGNTLDGILVDSSHNNTIIGNTCDDNDKYGISVNSSNHNVVSGNSCRGNSQDTDDTYDNIYIDGDYNLVTGNLCRDGGGANQPKYGIHVAGGTENKVVNNDLYDAGKTAPYNDSGTGTIYLEPEDTRDFLKYFGDRTLLSGGAISAHGDADGSVIIASCSAWCKETDADSADGVFFSYAGKAKQTLTDNSVNAIYLDYNAGTPQIVVATNYGTYGFQQDHILLGAVYRQGTTVHIFPSSNLGIQGINRTFMHEVEHHGAHRSSGLVTSDGGSRALSITTGVLYAGLNRHTTTVNGSTWSYWYTSDSGSTWTEDTGISALVQSYNNIASGKVALGTNKYGVHWVYVDIDGVHLHIVYGQGNYTANQAEEASVPSVLPPIVTGYCVLIAKIINQEGSNTLTITYPWTTVFTSSLATDHNSLANLTTGDVHTQYALIANMVTPIGDYAVRQTAATDDTPFDADIAGAPSATEVVYDGDSNEGCLASFGVGGTMWGRVILHNKTKSNSRKIVSVNTGTNTIITESSSDDWADNDEITTQSQTNTQGGYSDLDLSAEIPATAKGVFLYTFVYNPPPSTSQIWTWHPYEAYNAGKRTIVVASAAGDREMALCLVPVIDQKVTLRIEANGTFYILVFGKGYV